MKLENIDYLAYSTSKGGFYYYNKGDFDNYNELMKTIAQEFSYPMDGKPMKVS